MDVGPRGLSRKLVGNRILSTPSLLRMFQNRLFSVVHNSNTLSVARKRRKSTMAGVVD